MPASYDYRTLLNLVLPKVVAVSVIVSVLLIVYMIAYNLYVSNTEEKLDSNGKLYKPKPISWGTSWQAILLYVLIVSGASSIFVLKKL